MYYPSGSNNNFTNMNLSFNAFDGFWLLSTASNVRVSNTVLHNNSDDGFDISIYDLYYEDNKAVFDDEYDFICATEVIEHLADPVTEMKRLVSCLEPGGKLYILTQRYPSKEEFLDWYYKNDHTHISFFSKKTFDELAAILGVEAKIIDKTLVILTK